ncbi:hypothetical protein [Kiloniella sp.]|uniref:hypothetical protein n=1 Tax=Kiloniella sp. TaxID=1938587 RepID=UPI003B024931
MLKNWWILGAIPLLIVMVLSTFFLFSQKEDPLEGRKQIHTAITAFGDLTDRGIGQVEILSDNEIRFLITGGQSKDVLDNSLKEFCSLLLSNANEQAPKTPFELAYYHRQIPAISGNYSCSNDG